MTKLIGAIAPGGGPAVELSDVLAALTTAEKAALRTELDSVYVAFVPTAGAYTYNTDGTVASDPDGNTYTYNSDGTVATITKGGVTRTASYNSDGTIASWT